MRGRKTLVLDLDETLVHSTFEATSSFDFVLPIRTAATSISSSVRFGSVGLFPQQPSPGPSDACVYVHKRPGLHEFLAAMAELYEVVVFTASLARYADPLLDILDPHGVLVHHRLFREACRPLKEGGFVKDLRMLGRDLQAVILLDNSPTSYAYQPRNGLAISSYIDDQRDHELLALIPFLTELADFRGDVRDMLRSRTGEVARRVKKGKKSALLQVSGNRGSSQGAGRATSTGQRDRKGSAAGHRDGNGECTFLL